MKNLISDRLKVLSLVAKPIGEADEGITFISVWTSRFASRQRCAGKGVWGLPYYIVVY